jgi:hypothetical protein
MTRYLNAEVLVADLRERAAAWRRERGKLDWRVYVARAEVLEELARDLEQRQDERAETQNSEAQNGRGV